MSDVKTLDELFAILSYRRERRAKLLGQGAPVLSLRQEDLLIAKVSEAIADRVARIELLGRRYRGFLDRCLVCSRLHVDGGAYCEFLESGVVPQGDDDTCEHFRPSQTGIADVSTGRE